MSISVVEPPAHHASGRKPRLSDEDIKDLAEAIQQGNWASDEVPVVKESEDAGKSAAYQRAQSAVDLVSKRFQVERFAIKTRVYPVDGDDLAKGFFWAIGPRPEGETPRKKAVSTSAS